MKIAIATNDREHIAKRTGRASEYAIYTIENGKVTDVQYEENQHHHDDDHDRSEGNHRQVEGFGHGHGDHNRQGEGHGNGRGNHQHHTHTHHHHHEEEKEEEEHSHDEVVEQLKDIDMFLIRAVGKYLRQDLINGNIPFELVKGEKIDDIVQDYLKKIS